MNVLVSVYKLSAESQVQICKFRAEIIVSHFGFPHIMVGVGSSKEEAISDLKKSISEYKHLYLGAPELLSIDISDVLNLSLTKDVIDS